MAKELKEKKVAKIAKKVVSKKKDVKAVTKKVLKLKPTKVKQAKKAA